MRMPKRKLVRIAILELAALGSIEVPWASHEPQTSSSKLLGVKEFGLQFFSWPRRYNRRKNKETAANIIARLFHKGPEKGHRNVRQLICCFGVFMKNL